jgi:hypothetical protein
LISGLQVNDFYPHIKRKKPADLAQFRRKAEEWIEMEDACQSKRDSLAQAKKDLKPSKEHNSSRPSTTAQHQHDTKKKYGGKKCPPYQNKFSSYTALRVPQDTVLRQVNSTGLISLPREPAYQPTNAD